MSAGPELETHERFLGLLADLADALGGVRSRADVGRALRVFMAGFAPIHGLFLSSYDASRGERRALYVWSEGDEIDVAALPPLPLTASPHSRAVEMDDIVITDDFQAAVLGLPRIDVGMDIDPRLPLSSLAAPMHASGRVFGGIEVQSPVRAAFLPEHVQPIRLAANLAGLALQHLETLDGELELRRAAETSEERFRTLVGAMDDLVYTIDSAQQYTGLFGRWPAIHGSEADLALGRTARELYGDEAASPHEEAAHRALAGEPVVYEWALNIDGADHRIQTSLSPIYDRSGAIVGAVGVGRDITELRNAEEAVRRAQEEALRQEKLRALGQMAGGIAHDVNQSLGIVAGYAELARRALEQEPPAADDARDMLNTVAQAALDGGETVKRLLLYARAQEDGPHQPLDAGKLLLEVARLTAPRWRDAAMAEGRRIALTVQAEADVAIAGHPGSLRQALTNLVFNAVDAMPEGGAIRLIAKRVGDVAEIAVSDDGIGIPKDVQARVFEPFFTTKAERGTGLGLSQVFAIAERHGGTVRLDSAVGRGTTLALRLPLAAAEPHDLASSADEEAPAQQQPRQLSILIVDDEPMLAQMAAFLLTHLGHLPTVVGSGEEALEALGRDRYDVLISDVGMPGMSGWGLASAVRARWPSLPIALVTGWGAAIDLEEARSRGATAVLAKPYTSADLVKMLAGLPIASPRTRG